MKPIDLITALAGGSMNDDDIKRLREAAQAATPGPWMAWPDLNGRLQVGQSTNYSVAELYRTPLQGQDTNAAYIAAASPDAILALLSRLEAAERERDALAADARRYRYLRDADMDVRNRLDHYASSALDVAIDALAAKGQGK